MRGVRRREAIRFGMTVRTPPFLGLILRKNERTRSFIEQQIEHLKRISPEARDNLNEDEHLIAFSVAMNGHDLDSAIDELKEQHAVYGTDFVATGSPKGVLGELPNWLIKTSERIKSEYNQLVVFYSFAPPSETSAHDA